MLSMAIVTIATTAAHAEQEQNTKSKIKVSGFVNLTMSEDFNGYINNLDFLPSLIEMPGASRVDNQFRADFSTSRINFDYTNETEALGDVTMHMDVDFRGGAAGSYTPRMRRGYITVGNWLAGKTLSNFSDIGAMMAQVDFQGPSGYCFNFTTQLRYTYVTADEHLSLSAAAEYLSQSLSTSILGGSEFERVTQRAPTIPVYMQYNWGEARDNHLRLSAIYRPQSVYKVSTDEMLPRGGWGTQISGRIALCPSFIAYYNAIYGAGISEYISDLYGSEMEYTIDPTAKDGIEATPMYGYNVGAQINISKSIWLDIAYSNSTISDKRELFASDAYHSGTFVSGNIFYKATDSLLFATEYVWGERVNMSGETGNANRLYLMAQYNF